MPTGHRLVIGIGNFERGDEAVGLAVVRWLAGRVPPDVFLLTQDGEPTAIYALLASAGSAWLVDACRTGAPDGSIQRFDVAEAPLPRSVGLSTHGLGLADGIELARSLGDLPPHCVVYAIEAADFEPGAPLSDAVAAAVATVAERLRSELCAGLPSASGGAEE